MTVVGGVYEIYGIKFAEHRAGTRGHYFYGKAGEPRDEPAPIDYLVWVIRGDDGDIVVDAGFTADTAREVFPRPHFEEPHDAVRRIGVDPLAVTMLILTHLHLDHTGDVAAFPNATVVLQEAEMAFWTGKSATRLEIARYALPTDVEYLVGLNFESGICWVRGDTQLADGISVHLVPGHTPGSQAVRVKTAKGWVVLAGDAAHFYEEFEELHPFSVFTDLADTYDSLERLTELADSRDLVLPGHDPRLIDNFPAVPGHEGRVFRVA